MPTVFISYPVEYIGSDMENAIKVAVGEFQGEIIDSEHKNVDVFYVSVLEARNAVEEIAEILDKYEVYDSSVYCE